MAQFWNRLPCIWVPYCMSAVFLSECFIHACSCKNLLHESQKFHCPSEKARLVNTTKVLVVVRVVVVVYAGRWCTAVVAVLLQCSVCISGRVGDCACWRCQTSQAGQKQKTEAETTLASQWWWQFRRVCGACSRQCCRQVLAFARQHCIRGACTEMPHITTTWRRHWRWLWNWQCQQTQAQETPTSLNGSRPSLCCRCTFIHRWHWCDFFVFHSSAVPAMMLCRLWKVFVIATSLS